MQLGALSSSHTCTERAGLSRHSDGRPLGEQRALLSLSLSRSLSLSHSRSASRDAPVASRVAETALSAIPPCSSFIYRTHAHAPLMVEYCVFICSLVAQRPHCGPCGRRDLFSCSRSVAGASSSLGEPSFLYLRSHLSRLVPQLSSGQCARMRMLRMLLRSDEVQGCEPAARALRHVPSVYVS